MTFDLNMHVTRLLRDEPFFAELSRKMDKRSSKALPTAGVRVNPETAQFEMQSRNHKSAHEVMHGRSRRSIQKWDLLKFSDF